MRLWVSELSCNARLEGLRELFHGRHGVEVEFQGASVNGGSPRCRHRNGFTPKLQRSKTLFKLWFSKSACNSAFCLASNSHLWRVGGQ